MFAKYWDHVEDNREISGFSRFMSGGIGGITSQLSMQPVCRHGVCDANFGSGIYPIETVKTQMMSSLGGRRPTLLEAVKHVYKLGGMRAYYRGLAVSCRDDCQRSYGLIV
jgi:solute carrier family 25 phosphate transporter 23/24/25/41